MGAVTSYKAPRCGPNAKSKDFPKESKLDRFWKDVTGSVDAEEMDLDQLGRLALEEGGYASEAVSSDSLSHNIRTVDVNPIGGGTIGGSHQLLVMVFGKHGKMDKTAFRRVSIERKYPEGYTYGRDVWNQAEVGFQSMPLHWGTNSFGLPPSGGSWKEYRGGELVKLGRILILIMVLSQLTSAELCVSRQMVVLGSNTKNLILSDVAFCSQESVTQRRRRRAGISM